MAVWVWMAGWGNVSVAISWARVGSMGVAPVIRAVVIWVGVVTKIVSVRVIIIYTLDVVSMMTIPKISMIVDLMMMGMSLGDIVGVVTIWL